MIMIYNKNCKKIVIEKYKLSQLQPQAIWQVNAQIFITLTTLLENNVSKTLIKYFISLIPVLFAVIHV